MFFADIRWCIGHTHGRRLTGRMLGTIPDCLQSHDAQMQDAERCLIT